jgi:hypothetical protein
VTSTTKPATKPALSPDEIRKLLDRARKGDESTLPQVRRILKNPALVDSLGGDLALQAQMSLIKAAAGKDLVFSEALVCKLATMRAELAGSNPTPIERLLVERIVACWLQVHDADVRYAQGQGSATMTQGDYHQRRMDRAHRRYLSAIKTLATVRKLAVPVLQVNIAKKQVNIASAAIPSPCPGGEPVGTEAED